jgi:molecular chaperone DnaK (HSP70)
LVGASATYETKNAESTINGATRLIGRKYDDPIVQEIIKESPVLIVEGENNEVYYEVEYKGNKKRYSPVGMNIMRELN